MFKPTFIMGSLILVVLAFSVFQVERRVQSLRMEVEEVNRQIIAGREEIHVLEAEWAYLNKPNRLREVAQAYLIMDNISASQIQEIDNIIYSPISVSSNEF